MTEEEGKGGMHYVWMFGFTAFAIAIMLWAAVFLVKGNPWVKEETTKPFKWSISPDGRLNVEGEANLDELSHEFWQKVMAQTGRMQIRAGNTWIIADRINGQWTFIGQTKPDAQASSQNPSGGPYPRKGHPPGAKGGEDKKHPAPAVKQASTGKASGDPKGKGH